MPETTERDDAVVLERELDAPIELVWQMWTDPEHFAAWYGPGGALVRVEELDLRVGGRRLVVMEVAGADGPIEMWFVGEHRVVDEPHHLVYTEARVSDPTVVPSPSELTEVRVDLDDRGGRTGLVLTHRGVPADSPGATGWAIALDTLATRLTG